MAHGEKKMNVVTIIMLHFIIVPQLLHLAFKFQTERNGNFTYSLTTFVFGMFFLALQVVGMIIFYARNDLETLMKLLCTMGLLFYVIVQFISTIILYERFGLIVERACININGNCSAYYRFGGDDDTCRNQSLCLSDWNSQKTEKEIICLKLDSACYAYRRVQKSDGGCVVDVACPHM